MSVITELWLRLFLASLKWCHNGTLIRQIVTPNNSITPKNPAIFGECLKQTGSDRE